jgi:phosphoglycolate phosphatase
VSRTGLRFDHVAFDLDGTLIDSRADLAAATNHVLRSFGRPEIAPESVHALVGEGARRLVERAMPDADPTRVDEGVRRFLAHYDAHLLDATVLYPGFGDVLAELAAAGIVLTVLSNKPEGLSRRVLDGLGIGPRFGALIGGDSLPTRKPDPAGMEHLCRMTGSSAPRTLLVGDSPVDVATAANAGTAFCGAGWGFDPVRLRAATPAAVLASPSEILGVVAGDQSVRGGRATIAS